ncbi:MAG: tetratricopeptide repeat-containing protein [Vicinamibacterales bacterium]
MRAFIIRPFGTKAGVDFERVHADLLAPALTALHLDGGTTGEVIEAGNIREDMFQRLLVSDIVIADISIDNANVYYELGVRHALREKRTFLLRARGTGSDVPFDLRTDRYLPYEPADPAAALDALCAGLRATIASDRQDSPVFRVLPELREHPRSRLLPVPRGFREELDHAAHHRMRGKLALLGHETKGALWAPEGLRLVAREQFAMSAFEAAAITLESLRTLDPLDVDANLRLGTVYERLGDLARSEAALRRVLDLMEDARPHDRAEAWSLLGRNLKTRWRDGWKGVTPEGRAAAALDSPLLQQAYDAYARGFEEDLNHFYSGLNALALLTLRLALIDRLPDAWTDAYPSEDEAARARAALEARRRALEGAVDVGLSACTDQLRRTGRTDPWVGVSRADFLLLTATRPGPVVRAYADALAGQPDFFGAAVRRQLDLYQDLGLLTDKVTRVLATLAPAAAAAPAGAPPRTLLFTGHQVDAPGRQTPRFPADREGQARQAIRDAIQRELDTDGSAVGLAGAASGGDILFHEVCAELGVPTTVYLALPPEQYVKESVAPAGGDWIRRFWTLVEQHPVAPVLADSTELPGWLHHRQPYSIWQRNNLWTLNEALAVGARHVTVIALWNGKPGDGPGGTADMIDIARTRGARVDILATDIIFGLTR